MTLGERRDLGETYGEFQRAGLAHALALSGLNMAILAGFFVMVLYRLRHWRYLATLGILLVCLLLVGPQPSLVRAVMMSGLVLVGLFWGKGRVEVLPALSLALFAHLLLEPYAVFSISFQLWYLAVLGMAVVLPRLPKLESLGRIAKFLGRPASLKPLEGWKNWVWTAFTVTLAAQIFLLPLLLYSFHQLPILSPISNLLVLPFLNLLVPLGFLKLVMGNLLAWPVEILNQIALMLVGWMSHGPQMKWGEISPVGFALYFLGILPFLAALYQKIGWSKAGLLSATAVLASLLPLPFQKAEIWQLDVGQGDASLIRLPGNVEILVDGGREWAYSRLEGALKALNVDDLDLVIATEADADHIQALPELMGNIPVHTLITGPRVKGDPLDDALHQAAEDHQVQVIQMGT
jgi:competence protein ComEC